MWYEISEDYVIFRIKAQPASSKNEIAGIHDDSLKVKIKAPAVEGAANKELVKFFSKFFKLSKSDIMILSGKNGRQKRVKVLYNQKVDMFIKNIIKEGKDAGKSI